MRQMNIKLIDFKDIFEVSNLFKDRLLSAHVVQQMGSPQSCRSSRSSERMKFRVSVPAPATPVPASLMNSWKSGVSREQRVQGSALNSLQRSVSTINLFLHRPYQSSYLKRLSRLRVWEIQKLEPC